MDNALRQHLCALFDAGQWDQFMASARRAAAAEPFDITAAILMAMGTSNLVLPDAEWHTRRALSLNPSHPALRSTLGQLLLRRGEVRLGWALAQESPLVFLTEQTHQPADTSLYDFLWGARPDWSRPGSKPISLIGMGGWGDRLMYARFARSLMDRGWQVDFHVPKPLQRLLQLSKLGYSVTTENGHPADGTHYRLAVEAVPHELGHTSFTDIPIAPYLVADPVDQAMWAARLAPLPGLRVGLCWHGRTFPTPIIALHHLLNERSIDVDLLRPLYAVPGISIVNLTEFAEGSDWADTAALVTNLDLVISVDTAIAHLAGGLGKPVWLLDRFRHCWRWLAGRTDSYWYPAMRIFRQPAAGDWLSVVASVRAALETWEDTGRDH